MLCLVRDGAKLMILEADDRGPESAYGHIEPAFVYGGGRHRAVPEIGVIELSPMESSAPAWTDDGCDRPMNATPGLGARFLG